MLKFGSDLFAPLLGRVSYGQYDAFVRPIKVFAVVRCTAGNGLTFNMNGTGGLAATVGGNVTSAAGSSNVSGTGVAVFGNGASGNGASSETLTITGQFPYGRYMSFASYTPYLFSVDGMSWATSFSVAGST